MKTREMIEAEEVIIKELRITPFRVDLINTLADIATDAEEPTKENKLRVAASVCKVYKNYEDNIRVLQQKLDKLVSEYKQVIEKIKEDCPHPLVERMTQYNGYHYWHRCLCCHKDWHHNDDR